MVGDMLRIDLTVASPLALVGAFAAIVYLSGDLRMRVLRRRWHPMRTVSFVLGCATLIYVTSAAGNGQADVLVSVLVFQQITLMTVIPPLLLLGSPGTLLLRATPHRGVGRVVLRAAHGARRAPLARALLHPLVAPTVVIALFPGLYFTDLVSAVIGLPFGHELLLAVFLLAGIIAGAPLWSNDPLPRSPSYVARLADVVVEIQVHAAFGLVLLLSGSALFSAYSQTPFPDVPATVDQSIAGMLVWTYGELPLLIVLVVTLSRWRSRDIRLSRRNDVQEEVERQRYNDYLASLQRQSPS
ncbi:cytochrome c oxidase assembly protein [Microbacterium sp. SA39]|uniref:cytochrome c oxidase assembly protein n=1 Tax=Microbacterium sp. SA39 TaxID=1263625 RepID=UPI001F33D929|nr:cytochrome c oxidase assembly protein [Microbacterium sp. SA39]